MPNKFPNLLLGSIWIALPLCLSSIAAQAESRGYVIGWLATASYYTGDVKMGCPDGRNVGVVEMHARELEAIGFGKKEAVELLCLLWVLVVFVLVFWVLVFFLFFFF